jgi:hypothetical protein
MLVLTVVEFLEHCTSRVHGLVNKCARLNAAMAEQKLDLIQFSSGFVTQTCAGATTMPRAA